MLPASVLIGATIGCFFGGFISDRIGPKMTLLSSGVLCLLCNGGLAAQKHITILITIRLLSGLGLGCISSIGPLYVGEQSSAKWRGMFVAIYQLSICFGILIAYSINFGFSYVNSVC
jgi:MFS family permease